MACSVRIGFILWLAALTSWAGNAVLKPEMVGRWEGGGRIIVNWCQQTNLSVTLDIRANGTVTGKIGDATLTKGRLQRNRGWLGRKINIKTDYIITGRLEGAIVSAEGITRAGINMPVNYSTGRFVGGLHTTGSKFGGKTRMILSAGLSLSNAPPPTEVFSKASSDQAKSRARQKGGKE